MASILFAAVVAELALKYVPPYSRHKRQLSLISAPSPPPHATLSYGDSIGHGYKVAGEEAYPSQLEHLGAGPVIVGGGYCPTTYALNLRADLAGFKPKRVIVEIELSNDVSDEALLVWRTQHPEDRPDWVTGGRYLGLWDGGTLPSVGRGRVFESLRLYTLFIRALGGFLNRVRPNPLFGPEADTYYYNLSFDQSWLTAAALDTGLEHLFTSLSWMKASCDREGIPFLLVILPSQYAFFDNQYRRGALRLIAAAEQRARAAQIDFISLQASFATHGGADLFMDFCHPKAEGHRLIAEAIIAHLSAVH